MDVGLVGLLLLCVSCDAGGSPAPPTSQEEMAGLRLAPAPSASRPDATSTATLRAVDVYGAGRVAAEESGVRVLLSFQGAPLFKQRQLPAEGVLPARLSVELKDAALSEALPASRPVGRGGLQRVRLDAEGPRVVLDLDPGAVARVFFLTEPYRIVIDVSRSARASRAGLRPRPSRGPALIVLDPGHGGTEPGAVNEAHGLLESELALDLAKRVAQRLRQSLPGSRVLLTRSAQKAPSLEERVALANAMEADAFVSIHLNASSGPVRKGGVTTFVLDTSEDRQALRLAARENGTPVSAVSAMQGLLAKLHRDGQAQGSRALAEQIQNRTVEQGRSVLPELADRGVRSAMFYVLVGARMPAVLLEASFLSHEPEARALATQGYRQSLASGIAAGVKEFLALR